MEGVGSERGTAKGEGSRIGTMLPATLQEIVDEKRREVAARKERLSFAELEAMVAQQEPARNLFASVVRHPNGFQTSVIAEVKRRSPSAGWIRPEYEGDGFRPEDIARIGRAHV